VNKMLFNKTGLSNAEWISYFKMISNVAPVRGLQGRADIKDGNRCRRCGETTETLPQVLGACQFGSLLLNVRHHSIRTMIAYELRAQNYEVDEEVCVLDRRVDIISINRPKRKAFIVDPTVRFETNDCQPVDVDRQQKEIYKPVCDELMKKYNIKFKIEVIGLLVGARGVIFKDFHTLSKPLNLPKKTYL